MNTNSRVSVTKSLTTESTLVLARDLRDFLENLDDETQISIHVDYRDRPGSGNTLRISATVKEQS